MIQTFQLDLCPKGLKQRLEQIVAHQLLFNGYRFQFGKKKRVLEVDGSDSCTTVNVYLKWF